MGTVADPIVHGLRMRVTNLDQNGVPTPGTDQMYVTDAYTKVGIKPVYSDGNEIEVKNASGVTCVQYRSPDTFKRADIEIELCTYDPYLQAMLSGGTVETLNTNRVGWNAPAIGEVADTGGLSIEVWGRRVDDGEENADYPYMWFVYPRVKNLQMGDFEHGDDALMPKFSGQAYENDNWFDGPTNDFPLAVSSRVVNAAPTSTLPVAQVGYYDVAAS